MHISHNDWYALPVIMLITTGNAVVNRSKLGEIAKMLKTKSILY